MVIYKLNTNNNQDKYKFGIDAYQNGRLVKSVGEITENRTDMQNLIDLCNELEIEVCQLDYVIEDYLTDFSLY